MPPTSTNAKPPFATPTERVVMLGASNLTRGLATALEIIRRRTPEPVDLLAAMGNGRSFGLRTRIVFRGLSSILDCGLWRALAERPALPTAALVTDVGNDILYGAEVPQIAKWVEECLRRLQERGARTVVTGLPVGNLPRLGPWRFYALRTLLFPKNRDNLATLTARAQQLDDLVRRLAERYQATFVPPQEAWYGFDPIHIRMSQWSTAWEAVLADLHHPVDVRTGAQEPVASDAARPLVSLWNSLRAQAIVPEERTFASFVQRRAQPASVLRNGTRISIF